MAWTQKDPDEVLDYTIDWSDAVGADPINSSAWVVPAGITQDSDTYAADSATIWLSGGTSAETYSLQNTVTTVAGRTFQRSVYVRIQDVDATAPATLVVEDGSGLSTATGLISLDYLRQYAANRGLSVNSYTALDLEQAIVRASDHLHYNYPWQGWKVKGRLHSQGEQGQAWPRYDVYDREGYGIPTNVVPDEVKKACAELAIYEAGTPNGLTPTYTPTQRVTSEKVGPISITYDGSRTDAQASRPTLTIVGDLIGQFLKGGAGNRLSGGTLRT